MKPPLYREIAVTVSAAAAAVHIMVSVTVYFCYCCCCLFLILLPYYQAGVTAGRPGGVRRRHQALVADALNLAHALFLCSHQRTSAAEACEGPGFSAILGGITAQVCTVQYCTIMST